MKIPISCTSPGAARIQPGRLSATVTPAPARPLISLLVCLAVLTGCGSGPPADRQIPAAPTAAPVPATAAPVDAPTVALALASATDPPTSAPPAEPATVAPAEPPTVAVAEASATDPPTSAPPAEPATAASPPAPAAAVTVALASTATPEAASAAPPDAGGDAVAAIYHMLQAQAAVKSFRIHLSTATDAPGSLTVIDTVRPDRSHEVVTVGGTVTREVIGIAGTTYSRSANATWKKVPRTAAAQALMDSAKPDLTSLDSFRKLISTARASGTEDLAGTPTRVYQYTTTQTMAVAQGTFVRTMKNTLWIAVADGLAHKLVADSTTQANGHTATAPQVTMTYYDYNADITIEAPIP